MANFGFQPFAKGSAPFRKMTVENDTRTRVARDILIGTMRRLIGCVVPLLLVLPAVAAADTIDLGIFSFQNLIPDGTTPGVNVFDVSNFTGATWSLPPGFPVVTQMTLQDTMLTLDGSGGTQQIALGDTDPGLFSAAITHDFPTTETFTSATLTAILSGTSLMLFDGSTFTLASDTITATILPSIGDDLTAGTDFALITASGVPVSSQDATPEPPTSALLSGTLLVLVGVARKRLKKG